MGTDHYDVLILGAGLSGIGMACRLAIACPEKRVAIVEARHAIGGTWDLFRYPGVRSDSDMCTFGYPFRPWGTVQVMADGASIRQYVADTARAYGVDQRIHFGWRATRASWSSSARQWMLLCADERGGTRSFTCAFLVACTGYYDYARGHLPDFPGRKAYAGHVVHPQHWPPGLDWRGKRVVVIGSGATAMTLVPALAREAASVTMVQRSPGYVLSVPSRDAISAALMHVLPARWVHSLARRRNIALQRLLYRAACRWPSRMRSVLLAGVRRQLRGAGSIDDFSPAYDPWTQRLCVIPDADLFVAMREGRARVLTDIVAGFDREGLCLASGRTLPADIVVMATGFHLQALGGMTLDVDGVPRDPGSLATYKSVLIEDLPNLAVLFGYINASWTLKVDLAAQYVCRLLRYMDERGIAVATPEAPADVRQAESILDALKAGYVSRGGHTMPRQGRSGPWRVTHRYGHDRRVLLADPVDDAFLRFSH